MYRYPRLFCVLACLTWLCATSVVSATPLPTSESPSALPTPALTLSAVAPPADKGNGIDPDG